MATNKSSVQHICNFCNKEFMRENSLINHACVKKQRWLDKDTKWTVLGFLAYQRFYKLTGASGKKKQSITDFIDSRYYTDFIKMGRFLANEKIINPEGYIDYVIKNHIKLKEWCYDYTYEKFVKEVIYKENPFSGIERSISFILEWTKVTDYSMDEFFDKVNTNVLVNAIRGGKVSPWLIYLAASANRLLDRLDDSQLKMLQEHLNPKTWQIKKLRYKQECDQLKKLLKEHNL